MMKKTLKTPYASPQATVETYSLERDLLIVSVNVPGAVIDDAEEEEWIVS